MCLCISVYVYTYTCTHFSVRTYTKHRHAPASAAMGAADFRVPPTSSTQARSDPLSRKRCRFSGYFPHKTRRRGVGARAGGARPARRSWFSVMCTQACMRTPRWLRCERKTTVNLMCNTPGPSTSCCVRVVRYCLFLCARFDFLCYA